MILYTQSMEGAAQKFSIWGQPGQAGHSPCAPQGRGAQSTEQAPATQGFHLKSHLGSKSPFKELLNQKIVMI